MRHPVFDVSNSHAQIPQHRNINASSCTRDQCIALQFPARRCKTPKRRPTRINYVCISRKISNRRDTDRYVEIVLSSMNSIRDVEKQNRSLGDIASVHTTIEASKNILKFVSLYAERMCSLKSLKHTIDGHREPDICGTLFSSSHNS
jgi:hypothetical protein